MFPMRGLHMRGAIDVLPSSLSIRSVAYGGSASVALVYDSAEQRKDGALLVNVGAVRFGYKLGDDSKLVLFGATSWFEEQTRARSARAASGQ
jgi:hypothetical protein